MGSELPEDPYKHLALEKVPCFPRLPTVLFLLEPKRPELVARSQGLWKRARVLTVFLGAVKEWGWENILDTIKPPLGLYWPEFLGLLSPSSQEQQSSHSKGWSPHAWIPGHGPCSSSPPTCLHIPFLLNGPYPHPCKFCTLSLLYCKQCSRSF